MQTKDITVGADYAVRRHRYASIERATVTETGVRAHRAQRADGVRVTIQRGDGSSYTATLRSRDVLHPWDQYERDEAERREERIERARRQREQDGRRFAQWNRLQPQLDALGVKARRTVGLYATAAHVVLSLDDPALDRLIEALENAASED